MQTFIYFFNLEKPTSPWSIQLLATADETQPPTNSNHPYDLKSTAFLIVNPSNSLSSLHCKIMAVMAATADPDADADADEQTSVQFHQFVDLPAELRIKIIQEFITALRKQRRSRPPLAGPLPFPKFAPFAVIHSEWQHEFEAEQELFGSLCLSTDDLPAFHKMLNEHRSRFLFEVGLRVCIDNKVINFSEQSGAVVYRAGKFIVNSVATILESVENATRVGFQTTEAKLELYTQIITPQGFHRASSLPSRIKCDFSRLPLIHPTRKLSQRRFKYGQWNSLGYPRMLLISPSSMLTLASRMPNLEEADVGISSGASTGAIRGKSEFIDPKCGRIIDLSRDWIHLKREHCS